MYTSNTHAIHSDLSRSAKKQWAISDSLVKNRQVGQSAEKTSRPDLPQQSTLLSSRPELILFIAEKAGPETYNRIRLTNKVNFCTLTLSRRSSKQRFPVRTLEIDGEKLYITTMNRGRLINYTKYADCIDNLKGIQPETLYIDPQIFAHPTNRLLKKGDSSKFSDEWKDSVIFIQEQCGIFTSPEGEIQPSSSIAPWLRSIRFGSKEVPTKLVCSYLEKWRREKQTLIHLTISVKERIADKLETAQKIFEGMNCNVVWKPTIHEDSIFQGVEIDKYQDRMQKKYGFLKHEDPVAIYAALSDDDTRIAVLSISDQEIAIDFGNIDIKSKGGGHTLKGAFSRITKIEQYDAIDQYRLSNLYGRLSNCFIQFQ